MKNQRKIGPPLSKSVSSPGVSRSPHRSWRVCLYRVSPRFSARFNCSAELINIEFIILHSVYHFFSSVRLVSYFISFPYFYFRLELIVDSLRRLANCYKLLTINYKLLFNFCLHAALGQPRFNDVARLQLRGRADALPSFSVML